MLKVARQIIWIVILATGLGVYLNYDVLIDLLTEGRCPYSEIVQVCGEQPQPDPTRDVDEYFGGQNSSTTSVEDVDPAQFFTGQ